MYKAMIKKSKNKKGFTLVELIVVMAILAILAAILIPAVGGMIQRSNKAVDVATARNLQMAGQMMLANGKAKDVTITQSGGSFADMPEEFTDFIGNTAPSLKYANSMTLSVSTADGGSVSLIASWPDNENVTFDSANGSFGENW